MSAITEEVSKDNISEVDRNVVGSDLYKCKDEFDGELMNFYENRQNLLKKPWTKERVVQII